jgi:hypothetical protein
MNATAPRPIRFIVEATTSQIQELVAPLLNWLTPREHPHPESPPAPDDEEQDTDPPVERTSDPPLKVPPVARASEPTASSPAPPVVPELPAHLEPRYYLGGVCKRGHRFEGSDYSVRKRSNHGCAICNEQYTLKSRPSGQAPIPVLRPELPKHLGETCFLSPITCSNPNHRYRESAFTLRFLDTEDCVQCTTTTHQLAGD